MSSPFANDPARKTFQLNTGARIPAIGLGTWQSKPNEVRHAVKVALQRGYRHIDTALAYGNEAEVGQGIKDSGVPREDIWVTTKLDNTWHHRVEEGISTSLRDLDCGYVDLYLIHWPSSTDPHNTKKHLPDWDFVKTWYADVLPPLSSLTAKFRLRKASTTMLTVDQGGDAEAS